MTRLDFMEDVINNNEEYYDFGEQEICKQFGCGKKLTDREKLFGDKCINHGGEKVSLVINNGLITCEDLKSFHDVLTV